MECKEAQSLVMDYLNRDLGGKKLDSFLKHVRTCRECHEELEIYYMIHVAMQKLDSEEQVSYDVKHMLEEDLRDAEKAVRRWKIRQSYRYGIILLAECVLCLVVLTQIQSFELGGMEGTSLYRFFFSG